jgi:aryl carrier-like protein
LVRLLTKAEGLWAYLEDGLRKVEDGRPFNQYIPAVDWRIIDRQFTLPLSCRHLLSPNSKGSADSEPQQNSGEAILTRVLELLEVSEPDFDVAQPLTTYGLDSISAAKLSSMLRPYGSFSPMQLLGGATWSEIETQLPTLANGHALGDMTAAKAILLDILGISADDFSPDHPLSSYGLDSLGASRLATALRPFMAITQMQLMGQTTWTELLELAQIPSESSSPALPAQPFVEVCSGSGQPLIILPGGNGSMGLFFGLRSHYKGPLWAVQVTETTPLESLEALVGYWKDQICAKWPQGPYKLAAFSGSTLLSIALTKMLEDAGKEVLQLTFIDHCPALWLAEDAETRLREKTVADFRDFSDASLLELLRIDSTSAEALVSYEAAINGLPDAPTTTLSEVKVLGSVMTLIFNFLHQFYPADRKKSHESFVGPFTAWLSSVKAPLVLLVAELGFVHCSPDGWSDLGANRFTKPVKVHYINSVGHFGLFKDQRVAQILNA